jgi:hypothetical protein
MLKVGIRKRINHKSIDFHLPLNTSCSYRLIRRKNSQLHEVNSLLNYVSVVCIIRKLPTGSFF